MKYLFSILLISFSLGVYCQVDTVSQDYYDITFYHKQYPTFQIVCNDYTHKFAIQFTCSFDRKMIFYVWNETTYDKKHHLIDGGKIDSISLDVSIIWHLMYPEYKHPDETTFDTREQAQSTINDFNTIISVQLAADRREHIADSLEHLKHVYHICKP